MIPSASLLTLLLPSCRIQGLLDLHPRRQHQAHLCLVQGQRPTGHEPRRLTGWGRVGGSFPRSCLAFSSASVCYESENVSYFSPTEAEITGGPCDRGIKLLSWVGSNSVPSTLLQVLIRRGEVLCGTLCKKALGGAGGGLIHVIWAEHGCEATRLFLNNCQLTVNHWLLHHGMSIGIGDTVADDATMTTINDIIEKAKEEVREGEEAGDMDGFMYGCCFYSMLNLHFECGSR